jgi:hypothetical protein
MRQSSATTKIAPVTKNKQQQLQQQQLKKNQQQHHVVKTKNPSSSRSVTFAPPPPAPARDPAPTLVRMQPYMATTHQQQQQQQPSPVQHVAIPHEQFAQQEFSQLSSSTSSSLMHTSVASYNQQQKQQYQPQQQHHHHHHSQQQQHQQQHHSRQHQHQHHSQQQQVPLHQPGWSSVSGGGANRGMDASISSFPRSAASASCNSTFGMHRPGGGGASTIGQMSAGAASLHPFSISGVGSGRGGNSSQFPGHSSVFTNNSKSNSSRSTIPQQQQQSRAAKNWQIMQNMNDTAVVAPHASHRQAASTTTTTTTPRRPTRLVVPPPASGARIAAVLVARQEQQRAAAAANGAMVQQYPPAPQSVGRPHTSHASVCVARSSSKKMRGTAAVEPLLSQPSTTKTPTKTTPQQHKLRNYVASLVDDKVSTDVPALFNAKKKELDDSISTIVSGQVTALFDAKSKQLGESVSSVNHDLEAKKKEFQDNMSIASGQFNALVDAKTKELNKNLSNVNGQVTVLIGVKNELEELLSETVQDLRARAVALKEQHLELDNKAGTLIKMIQASGAEAVVKVESFTETAIAKIMDAGKGWFDKITKPFRSFDRIHSQEEKSRQSSIGNTSGSRPVSSNSSTMVSPPVRALLSKKDEGKTPQTTKALSKSNTSRKISSNSSAFVSPPARKVEGKGEKLQSSTVTGKDRPPKHITTAGVTVTVKVKDMAVKKKKHEVKKKTSNKAGGKSKKSHPPPKKTVHEDDVDARFQDLVNLGPVPRSRSSRSNKKRTMDKESPLLPINPSKRARTITTPVQKSVPASVHLPAIKQTSQLSQRSSSVATQATTVKSQQVPTRSRVIGTFGRNARYAAALSDSDTILY